MWRKLVAYLFVLVTVLWLNEALYVTTGAVTVAWDAQEAATYYEVEADWIGAAGKKATIAKGTTTQAEMEIVRPRVGFFEIRVRACNETGCSEWATSSDPAYGEVDGAPKGWRLFFELPAPAGGGIN